MRELDPPYTPPVTVNMEGKVTSAMGFLGKGECKVSGQLLTPRACQNSEAMLKMSIDNSQCQKMVANIRFKVKRTITAYAKAIDGSKKEFKDEQQEEGEEYQPSVKVT